MMVGEVKKEWVGKPFKGLKCKIKKLINEVVLINLELVVKFLKINNFFRVY